MKRHIMFVFHGDGGVYRVTSRIELLMEDTDEECQTFRPSVTGLNLYD